VADSPQFSDSKRKLLEKYLRQGVSRAGATDGIRRRPSGIPAPLSLSQEQVLLEARALNDKPPVYVECFGMHRSGPLDIPVLERCLQEIFHRHEIWRTSYEMKGERILQRVHPPEPAYKLPMEDVRSLPLAERGAAADRFGCEQACAVFDLQNGPLVRSLLVQLGDAEFRLYMTAHQSVVDGISVFRIFPMELTQLYESFSAGRPSPLADLPIQFADYASWQRCQAIDDQIDYWKKQLEGGLPVSGWPASSAQESRLTQRGLIYPFLWSQALTDELRRLSHQQEVTLFSILLAGFSALLHSYTGEENIILGTLSPSGRKRPEVQSLLGYFLNPVALRIHVKPEACFNDLLQEAKDVISGALSNDDVPLSALADQLKPNTAFLRPPFFHMAISLGPDVPALPAGWKQTYMDVGSGGSRWPLYIEFSDRGAGLVGRAQYNPDFIPLTLLQHALNDFEELLGKVCSQPNRRLSEISSSRDTASSG
jgi:aspartate racemase